VREVLIVAGEASGDLHAGLLAEALRRRRPDLHLVGTGGPRMAAAGVEMLSLIHI
jgi:lipid-A-disaccharide synthase